MSLGPLPTITLNIEGEFGCSRCIDLEKELEALRASIDMLRPVVIQLQMDVHTLKSQQYLKDWSINGK